MWKLSESGPGLPVKLPQRIAPELTEILRRYHPLYINTHFNSTAEITGEARESCRRLADVGTPLGNQMVLLNGVNNDKFVVRRLNQLLLKLRVKPYYIFHPKTVRGTSHFWVRLEEGLGKTPILPSYLLYIGKDKAVFRSWDNQTFNGENHPYEDSDEPAPAD